MDFLIKGTDYLAQYDDFRLVGRDAELERLVSILMRKHANSVILMGAGGVGCTTLCVGIQAAKTQPNVPFDILKKRLFWLDADRLFSLGDSESINHGFQRIINRLEQTNESILIIEDTRDFIEACRINGTTHFITALLVAVQTKKTQAILEIKDDDLETVLKAHSDMRELFTILPIDPPTGDNLEQIVTVAASSLSRHHGIPVTTEAIKAAIELTNRNQTRDVGLNRSQPERSITLLDRALAAYRLEVHRSPPGFTPDEWQKCHAEMRDLNLQQREGELQIVDFENQIDGLISHEKDNPSAETRTVMFQANGFQSPEITGIRGKIRAINAELVKIKGRFDEIAKTINTGLSLDRMIVLREYSKISGIPMSKLDQDEIAKLRELDVVLKRRVYGQDNAVKRVSSGIRVMRVGGRNKGLPLPYLFLGPSGCGKTELSKAIAQGLLDDETAISRFDMSEYMEKHAVAKMIGAPPGYEGYEAGGILTNLMRRSSHRVLLFDEIEKAHRDVFNIFLQVLGDGRLTDGIGRTVNFNGTPMIFTTNAGQAHFLNPDLSEAEAEAAALAELSTLFLGEFLNRFAGRQNIICFKKLDLSTMERIVRREITSMDSVYAEKGIHVAAEDSVIAEFCRDQYDPMVGARGLPGFITANLEPHIVDAILEDQNVQGTARVEYLKDQRMFDVKIAA